MLHCYASVGGIEINGEVVVWLDFVYGTLLVCANTETLSLEGI